MMNESDVETLLTTWRENLGRQMNDLKLRQWCIERAIELQAKNAGVVVVTEAAAIFEFITMPFGDSGRTTTE